MGFDLRRCVEAAVQAALAEAFVRPDPKRSGTGRKRRLRPFRAALRLVRMMLMGVGLVSTVRFAIDAERRRRAFEVLAARFPIEDLLEEIAVEVDAARSALADAAAEDAATQDASAERTPGAKARAANRPKRRPMTRNRGDSNGARGRKPPDRGTRAA